MVASLCYLLEWCQFSQQLRSRLFHCDRHIRPLGLWSVFGSQWMQLVWPMDWAQRDIMAKELLPFVLSCAVWGPLLSCSNMEFKCDNRGIVDSINKGSSKEPLVLHFLRCLWYFSACFYSSLYSGRVQYFCWSAVKKPIGRGPRDESPRLHRTRSYPTVIIKTTITKKAGLDFPLLSAPLQAYHQ